MCIATDFDAAVELELFIDIVKMHFNRPFTDKETFGDFGIVQPNGHMFDDLDFPRRQHLSSLEFAGFALEQFFKRVTDRAFFQP